MTTRREFLKTSALVAGGGALRVPTLTTPLAPPGRIDVRRPPDSVLVETDQGQVGLTAAGERWSSNDVLVLTTPVGDALRVRLSAPQTAIKRVRFRWRGDLHTVRFILGDAWERAYGDLEWRGWVIDRVMPWYFATTNGSVTHAYGVRTGANAFCHWEASPEAVDLWMDVRSGSSGLRLGERTLDVCDVVARAGREGESSFAAIQAFCRAMCPNPRLPAQPLYGSNDWYWAYGKNSVETVLADAQHIVELSPSGSNRPFAVIDDGWQPVRGSDKAGVGTWDKGNEKFPDMPALAARVKQIGARPGIWIRPLQAPANAPDAWRLARDRSFLDPSLRDVRRKVAEDIGRLRGWGFELIKHDYTTFDVFGRWGFQMGSAMTRDGWTFAEGPVRTTAQVIGDLYRTIREAADTSLVIGCNTVSHLSAGQFEICRIGDDTSGTEWARTRKMGVNTLAFRGAQHGAFYVADADCVGVTTSVPWNLNRQWLDLLSRSGTMLFVSLAPDALGAEQRRDLTAALARAAAPQALGEPVDWQSNVYPTRWRFGRAERRYDWMD